jgi:hypothetical protein
MPEAMDAYKVKCENCGREPAVVRVTRIVQKKPLESHLCETCAWVPELAALPRCAHCGKEYALEELKKLFQGNPPPLLPDPAAFQKWESQFTCGICGGRLFQ